jgi:excisionase family DNA binding protein
MPKTLAGLTLFTVEELSEILDIQETTIRKYLRDGKLKGRKLARRWYVSEENLQDFFRQTEPDPEPEEA